MGHGLGKGFGYGQTQIDLPAGCRFLMLVGDFQSMKTTTQRLIVPTALYLILCLLTNTATAQENWKELYFPIEDTEIPYRLMTPYGFDERESYPVIVSLHGGGGRGTDNQKQLKVWNQQLADEQRRKDFPCYVVAPQSTELWNENHLNKIKAIIADLPSADSKRIYVMGHSMGGHGINILLQVDPHYFAAAAPSAGTGRTDDNDFIEAKIIKDIPVWAFHGDKDTVCPYGPQQKLFAEMQALGGNMKLSTFSGDGHGISGKFITGADNGRTQSASDRCDPEADFMTWLFSHSLDH